MYSQFRSQYPTGSLTSELLMAEPGNYVVRALIQVGETILATGLSSAPTVEEAEDQARDRALVVLGIEAPTLETQAHLMGDPARLQPASSSEDLQAIANRALDAAPAWGDLESDLPISETSASDWVADEGIERRAANGNRRQSPKSPRQKRKSAPSSKKSSTLDMPLDLSDTIAQTDVELKRLGWTSTQGRQYLQRTYSKRSRQHLTDQELLEFLSFLRSQAIADEPPF